MSAAPASASSSPVLEKDGCEEREVDCGSEVSSSASAVTTTTESMRVTKRAGQLEEISFDKILKRVKTVGNEAGITAVNYTALAIKVIDQLYDTISTSEIDELMAQQCASMNTQHCDYATLAAHLVVSNHQKNTESRFSVVTAALDEARMVAPEYAAFVREHAAALDAMIQSDRDYFIDYFGFKTLAHAYLYKVAGKPVERPQHMWMRVAVAIHHGDAETHTVESRLQLIEETYRLMSLKYFTHATPTLFNAGTARPQLSSCFLNAMESDSIEGIYNTLKDCATISKHAGGIAVHIHNVRAKGSHIRGTNGKSTGIIPMLRVFNNSARYVDQGGGKRSGSIAVYLEPWHPDIADFLELRKTHGDEDARARDLFTALWIPDLFMERVKADAVWSMFCPDECPGLSDCYGAAFRELYTRYEREGRARRTMPARELWSAVLDSQMETGTPYLLYKDAANAKSNQRNLGTIKSSNLCCEIMEYSDSQETAVCNLASIALPTFVNDVTGVMDYTALHEVTRVVTRNLDRIIDINYYPIEKARRSNMRHRPIGVGVQGLADMFLKLDVAFHSEAAKEINRLVFETIYHAALTESCALAKQKGAHWGFAETPAAQGELQFDMWGVTPASGRYDWAALKTEIRTHGLRNSLLTALMPTASTSQILGFNECFEPYTSNLYSRRTSSGDFVQINRFLMRELTQLGVWNKQVKDNIIANNGSIQQLTMLPEHVRNKYKTVWQIPMRHLIDMSAERGAFICGSQSLNLWQADPVYSKLTSMHFYAWERGLKTGIYYLRRQAAHKAQQFTLDPRLAGTVIANGAGEAEEEEGCTMCSA